MPRLKEDQISRDKNGYYRYCIGVEPHPKKPGEYRKAEFALGPDLHRAKLRKRLLWEVWNYPGDQPTWEYGQPRHWTPEMLERVERYFEQTFAFGRIFRNRAGEHQASADLMRRKAEEILHEVDDGAEQAPQPVVIAEVTKEEPTLHAALSAYCKFVRTKPGSAGDKRRAVEAAEVFKHCAADLRALEALREDARGLKRYNADPKASKNWDRDRPIGEVTRAFLEAVTNHLKSRPLSRKLTSISTTMADGTERLTHVRHRIAADTVRTVLGHWRRLFSWIDSYADEDRFCGWTLPRRHERLWDVDVRQIMSKSERDMAARGPEQISIAEIKWLVHAALRDEHRLWLLFALFSAQGQTELACTRWDEIDFATEIVTHSRSKTGVEGRYWLPPEVIRMLKASFDQRNAKPNDLAFITTTGTSLVTNKSDAVRQMYDDLRKRVKKRAENDEAVQPIREGITFYSFRRFFGDWMNQHGIDLETALSHAHRTIGRRHYSGHRDFAGLHAASRQLAEELRAAGVFDSLNPERSTG